MELLQLDIAHIKSQLDLTGKFLPEAFFQHGQDGDGVQVALLFPNLVQRLKLLSTQVRNKVCSSYYIAFTLIKFTFSWWIFRFNKDLIT